MFKIITLQHLTRIADYLKMKYNSFIREKWLPAYKASLEVVTRQNSLSEPLTKILNASSSSMSLIFLSKVIILMLQQSNNHFALKMWACYNLFLQPERYFCNRSHLSAAQLKNAAAGLLNSKSSNTYYFKPYEADASRILSIQCHIAAVW